MDVPNGKEVDAECCDMSVIQPTVIRDSENTMSSVAMSKVLLERLLLRKELRLRIMQEKLEEQTMELEEAKKKLAEYEKMFGFKKFQFLSKLFSRIIWFGVRKVSGARRGGVRAVSSFYQVTAWVANIKDRLCLQVKNDYHLSSLILF